KSVLKSDRRDDADEILLFEGVIEAFLAEADNCPLRVSQPHEASITRSGGDFYLMKNYIEGAPLNDSDINNITPEMQKQLGGLKLLNLWLGWIPIPGTY